MRFALFAACYMLVSCLAYSSTLNMRTIYPSEISLNFHRTARRHILEDRHLHNHRCRSLESNINFHGCKKKEIYFEVLLKTYYFLGERTVTMTTSSYEVTAVQANS
jgi:hypothetical protein